VRTDGRRPAGPGWMPTGSSRWPGATMGWWTAKTL